MIFKRSSAPIITSVPAQASIGLVSLLPGVTVGFIVPNWKSRIILGATFIDNFNIHCATCDLLEYRRSIHKDIDDIDCNGRTCEGFDKLHQRSQCKLDKFTIHTEATIDVPTTMWTASELSISKHYYQFAVKNIKGKVYRKPYRLANVYGDGHICWGRSNKVPIDIGEAFKSYWSLPFNSDLTDERENRGISGGNLTERLESYTTDNAINSDSYVIDNWKCCDDIFNANCIMFNLTDYSDNKYIVVWTDKKILDQLPEKVIKQTKRRTSGNAVLDKAAVSLATKLEDGSYLLDFSGFKVIKKTLTSLGKLQILGNVQI